MVSSMSADKTSADKSAFYLEDEESISKYQNENVKNRRKVNKTGILLAIGFIFLVIIALSSFIFFKFFINSESVPCERKIVAYYPFISRIPLTERKLSLVTHLIFFGHFLRSDGVMEIGHNKNEKKRMDDLVKTAKARNVSTMISAHGNWDDIIDNSEKKKKFIDSSFSLIEELELDGIDVFWKWPKTESDMSNLASLLGELREKFNQSKRRLMISYLVKPSENSNQLMEISKNVDFLNVDTNNHNDHIEKVGPGAPLFAGSYYKTSVDDHIHKLACWTKTPQKLNLIVCPDVRYWKNVQESTDNYQKTAQRVNGKIDSQWFYWKDLKNQGWDISEASWNNVSKTPYIWREKEREYLTFENERSVEKKVEYAEDKNIGGITFWDLLSDNEEDTILKVVSTANLCTGNNNGIVEFDCNDV